MIRGCRQFVAGLLMAIAMVGPASPPRAQAAAPAESYQALAAQIDQHLAAHWQARGITPAAAADDATVYRRLMLDLSGRIPTRAEWEAYLADKADSTARYQQAVQQLLEGPEFELHLGAVLEEMLQGPQAGNPEFTDYLRRRLRQRKSWDGIFRELLLGPWVSEESKPATRFLEVRAKDLDRLTTDAARVFFGVDVSCARCHDHPLVEDWKQDHYYGMASFFNRTTGGKGSIGEKFEGDVSFQASDGTQKTAALMFLSGQVIAEPPAEEVKTGKFSRREQLVRIALEEQSFLSRSLVNRMWRHCFGRGLVEPVDQMHSGNPSSVPGLLELLAQDFAASGYDLHRLVGAIVSTKAYRHSTRWDSAAPLPDEGDFAVARLRLLSPRQYAMSLLVATGRAGFPPPSGTRARAEKLVGAPEATRVEQYLAAEEQAAPLRSQLDPGQDGQTSTDEALFLSNNSLVQTLVSAEPGTLAERLAKLSEPREMARAAMGDIFCRPPLEGEVERFGAWLAEQDEQAQAAERMIWVLVTSAEFRFQH